MKQYIRLTRVQNRDFPEEFFHFMWGYSLPGLSKVLNEWQSSEVLIEPYGPILDSKFGELLNTFDFSFRILPDEKQTQEEWNSIYPSRWDIFLIDFNVYQQASLKRKLKTLARLTLDGKLWSSFLFKKRKCLNEIIELRSAVINRLQASESMKEVSEYDNAYLFLIRSGKSALYDLQKSRGNLHRYGAERRALVGIPEGIEYLKEKGYNVVPFESGKYAMWKQIEAFHRCKGIIGIRGAELSNILWMKPQTQSIVIDNFNDGTSSPTRVIAAQIGVHFDEIHTEAGQYPELDQTLLTRIENVIRR